MQAVRQKLAQAGHNLWASLPLDSLSSRTRQLLVDSHAEAEDYEYLLLLGKVPANNRSTYLASTSGSKFIGSKARRSSSFLASGYFSNNVCK